ncbi:MAG: hypothetical protein WCP93_03705 [Candidatus Berkelbacteria bacterium]
MRESKLTIEEKKEIEEEIEKLQNQREKIGRRERLVRKINLFVLPVSILYVLISFAHRINNSTLISWYDALSNRPPTMLIISLILFITVFTIAIITTVNESGEKIAITRIAELRDRFNGKIVDQEKEKLEKLRYQLKIIWYLWLPFMILTFVCCVFSRQFGIKIDSENYLLNYITSICQDKSYQIIIHLDNFFTMYRTWLSILI